MLSREVTAKGSKLVASRVPRSGRSLRRFPDQDAAARRSASMPTSRTRWRRPTALPAACSGSWRWRRPCRATGFRLFFASQLVLKQQLVLSPQNEEATLTSQEFVLKSRARALLVRHSTDVTNNWLSLSTTLVEKNTGESYQGEQESATTRASTMARAGPRDRRPTKWSSRPYRRAPTTWSSSTNSAQTMRRRWSTRWRSSATRPAGRTSSCC
jgi:hypothetical protein